MADRLQRSGRNNPCPACGRTKDADCAFNHDIILCHQGSDARPTDGMRVGQTLTINGQPWALIRTNAGYSGSADLLKPHSERSPRPETRIERRTQELMLQEITGRLAVKRHAFLLMVLKVRGHHDPYWLTLAELNAQQAVQEKAWKLGTDYANLANRIGRYRPDHCREMRMIACCLKEINYQRKHTLAFRKHHLGERNG